MRSLTAGIMVLVMSLLSAAEARAADLYFEAEDTSLIEKMYPENLGMWPVIGNNLYIHPNWGRMPLRYTLKAAPNTVYDVIFFTGDNDPGVGNLDISWDGGKTWDTSYRNVAGERKVKEKLSTDESGVVSFIIAHTVGINSSLNYIKLVNLSTPRMTVSESLVSWISESPQPRVEEILKRLSAHPDLLQVLWRPKGTYEWSGQTTGWIWDAAKGGLNATVKGDKLFSASVTGADYEGAVRLRVTAAALQGKDSAYELMVAASFEPRNWQRQFYPMMPYKILKPEIRTASTFLTDPEDETPEAGICYFPFGVLENKEGFLFWGAMDVGRFRAFAPNAVPNSVPCFIRTPARLSTGRVLDFDITLKWFPKPEFKYRDVLHWYMCSMENSDPLTKDWVRKWDGKPYARPLAGGNLGAGGSPGQLYEGDMHTKHLIYKDSWKDPSERALRALEIGNIWFMYFRPSAVPSSVDKTWKSMWGETASREDMLEQLHWFKARGAHPFFYQNQFLGSEKDVADDPSLRKWIAYDEHGEPFALYKIGDKLYYFADFGNDEYRGEYIKRLKECVDFYKPDGLAWDMGFGSMPGKNYSRSNPSSSFPHGVLRVQAELWEWIHEKYPHMRVITNESHGGLAQRVSDAVILENAYGGGKGKLDYEAGKAMATTLIAGEYPRESEFLFQGIPTADYPYFVMRYRAQGLDTGARNVVVSAGLPWGQAAGPVIKGSDLEADGQWHTIVADLKQKLPNIDEVKMLTVSVSSARAEGAFLQIECLRFSKDAAGAKTTDMRDKTNPLPYQSLMPVELDVSHFDFWAPVPASSIPPAWAAASDFSAQIKDGTTEFMVNGEGRRMEWITLPPKFTANLMRVMSYGGCLGFGGVSEYWPEMTEFSAKTMSLPLAVGSHDVEVDGVAAEEEMVTASTWSGGGRLFLAAYNDGEKEEVSKITIVSGVLKNAGVRQIKSSTVHILGHNGRPLADRSAEVRLTEKDALEVGMKLGPGQALLLRVNDGEGTVKTQ